MPRILLLYDTQVDDLARDVKDLLTELGCDIVMIPKAADGGRTLQGKEEAHFASAAGAIFLITPGSTRDNKLYPSPSVADEMGQARTFFKSAPEKVVYLVEKGCQVQSVDQRCYVPFDRANMRSVLGAVTSLVRNLKAAGFLGMPKLVPAHAAQPVDIKQFATRVDLKLKNVCIALSNVPNGSLLYNNFDKMLALKLGWAPRDINFARKDLLKMGLIAIRTVSNTTFVTLTDRGFELARHELLQLERSRKKIHMPSP